MPTSPGIPSLQPPGSVYLDHLLGSVLARLGARKFKFGPSENRKYATDTLERVMSTHQSRTISRDEVFDRLALGGSHSHIWVCPDEPRTFEFLQARPQPLLVLSEIVAPKSFMCKAFIRLVLQEVVLPESRYRAVKAEVKRNLAPSRRRKNPTDGNETVLDYFADSLAAERRISDEAIFEKALETLSSRDRKIVLLRAHGEEVAAIVRSLGLKKSQVYVILDRFSRLCNELMDRAKTSKTGR